MIIWTTRIQTLTPIQKFPQANTIASEAQISSTYYLSGKNRSGKNHGLFKYTLAGTGIFEDAEGCHSVSTGNAFLCEVKDTSTSYYYPRNATETWRFIYMTFAGESALIIVRQLIKRYGAVFTLPANKGIVKRLASFANPKPEDNILTPAESAALVLELLTSLARCKEEHNAKRPGNILIRRAQEAIQENLYSNLNVTELAILLGVSREHLSRVFKEQTGSTPHAFLLQQKLLMACNLLKETKLRSKEIAARLGFDSAAQFSRVFSKTYAIPPQQFRLRGEIPIF